MGKRYCAIQVDADGLWVLQRLLGNTGSLEPDPVFEAGIDRLLKLFAEFGIKATFFVVARDLESSGKAGILRQVACAGHEIASHGMAHRYMCALDAVARRDEIASSKTRIEDSLGVKVAGFKSAGFAAHRDMVRDLEEAGYLYDSSVFGTSLAFLMEAFSGVAYPKWSMVTAINAPYRPSRGDLFRRGESSIVEMPVTVMPWLRLPMHFSYALLGGSAYAAFTAGALRISRPRFVSYLFHPLDMVDTDSVRIDGNVHGLAIKASIKLAMARKVLSGFVSQYEVRTSGQLCEKLKESL